MSGQTKSMTVVSILLDQCGEMIKTVTNDEDLQLRVVYNHNSDSREKFKEHIRNSLESADEAQVQDIDFVEIDSEYVSVISL